MAQEISPRRCSPSGRWRRPSRPRRSGRSRAPGRGRRVRGASRPVATMAQHVAAAQGEGDLAAQEIHPGALELIQCSALRRGHEPERASNEPAWRLAWAAASARSARRAGSAVSATERCRNGRGRDPAASLRPAGRALELGGDVLVGPGRGLGPVPGRRSGSRLQVGGLGQGAMHLVSLLERRRPARLPTTRGCRNRTRAPNSTRPASAASVAAWVAMPESRSAAHHISTGSPTGSAAASCSRRRVSSGSTSSRRRALLDPSRQWQRVEARTHRPALPGSPRGSSTSASRLPAASASGIRSWTRGSSGPVSTQSSAGHAHRPPAGSPTTSSGNPASSSPRTRAANTRMTDSAARRRAANPGPPAPRPDPTTARRRPGRPVGAPRPPRPAG